MNKLRVLYKTEPSVLCAVFNCIYTHSYIYILLYIVHRIHKCRYICAAPTMWLYQKGVKYIM